MICFLIDVTINLFIWRSELKLHPHSRNRATIGILQRACNRNGFLQLRNNDIKIGESHARSDINYSRTLALGDAWVKYLRKWLAITWNSIRVCDEDILAFRNLIDFKLTPLI